MTTEEQKRIELESLDACVTEIAVAISDYPEVTKVAALGQIMAAWVLHQPKHARAIHRQGFIDTIDGWIRVLAKHGDPPDYNPMP